ncbi:hypothetical protein P153DRAFT_368250 [Dothidotthia symphoricarpi CBS 119687]|uniref:Uncharacterized protein n=1 Tax=Dothidotthia symphoricarpi CBS 119687 TaxID=1392245 RepID=A0A6A6A908_9PLEO|nr:uncharacterized protein P153DRAFT_368250 [Dothidotthia symphoricarpi CBS 119687]KAF2127675.1 hypothetical protein P153DRAFT_368250 [Dothidotthia symphoricarpi CBS 119687]
MSVPNATIAFFGATGGTACSALAHALRSGYHCTALARTPEKLHSMLTSEHKLDASLLTTNLTIIPGHAKDIPAVAKTLISPLSPTHLVSTIFSGIGSLPKFQVSLLNPITLTDMSICFDCTTTIFSALEVLREQNISSAVDGRKPLFLFISTTGLSNKKRDVPFALWPLYRWLLHVPHEDKKKSEELLFADRGGHVRDFVIVRPTLLTDSEPKGAQSVKAGWEWGLDEARDGVKELGPMLGYSVGRKDVGEWIFKKCVVEGGWEGRCVSLTY